MSDPRICVLGLATPKTIATCLSCIEDEISYMLFVEAGNAPTDVAEDALCEFVGEFGDSMELQDKFTTFQPTDVILVCEQYEHDDVVDTIVDWCKQTGIEPGIHVYLYNILHEGYLEIIRKHPMFSSEGSGR